MQSCYYSIHFVHESSVKYSHFKQTLERKCYPSCKELPSLTRLLHRRELLYTPISHNISTVSDGLSAINKLIHRGLTMDQTLLTH